MNSSEDFYSYFLSTEEKFEKIKIRNKKRLKSKIFLYSSHAQLLSFLKTGFLYGISEFELFEAVLNWARTKLAAYTNPTEDPLQELEMLGEFLSPEGQEDLMGAISFPSFGTSDWEKLRTSKDFHFLPQNVVLNLKYFEAYAGGSGEIQERIKNLPAMQGFDFRPRGPTGLIENEAETFNDYVIPSPLAITAFSEHDENDDPPQPKSPEPNIEPVEDELTEFGGWPIITGTQSRPSISSAAEQPESSGPAKKRRRFNYDSDDSYFIASNVRKSVPVLQQPHANAMSASEPQPSTSRRSRNHSTLTPTAEKQFQPVLVTLSEYFQHVDPQSKSIRVEFMRPLTSDKYFYDSIGLNNGDPIYLPILEELHLKFSFIGSKPEDIDTRFKNLTVKTVDLKKYFCFNNRLDDGKAIKLTDLWSSGVDLSLEFHGCVILNLNHQKMELVLNSPQDPYEILQGLYDAPLKKLALAWCDLSMQLPDELNFEAIETLVLYGVQWSGIKGHGVTFDQILLQCLSVEELVLFKKEPVLLRHDPILESVNLSNLPNPKKLKWLAISRAKISARRTDIFTNVEELHLQRSICSKEFLAGLALSFPNLTKLTIYDLKDDPDGYGISLKNILSVLGIKSLQKCVVGKLNWDQEDSRGKFRKEFRSQVGWKNANDTCFTLTRTPRQDYIRKWEFTIYDKTEWEFDNNYCQEEVLCYKLDAFYKDFSPEIAVWLTYSHFNVSFNNMVELESDEEEENSI